jgi:hypothetical protein
VLGAGGMVEGIYTMRGSAQGKFELQVAASLASTLVPASASLPATSHATAAAAKDGSGDVAVEGDSAQATEDSRAPNAPNIRQSPQPVQYKPEASPVLSPSKGPETRAQVPEAKLDATPHA